MATGYRLQFGAPNLFGGQKEDVDDSKLLLWEAGKVIAEIMGSHDMRLQRLSDIVENLQNTLELSRQAYNQAIIDRDNKRQQLVAAEGRLAEVQRVVQRYTVVQDPVVASDGYTYERQVIKQYLDECEASEASAYSQQTKEVLKDVLIPNQSLKKLVELLRTVKPQEVPQATPRSAIPPFRTGGGGNAVNWVDDTYEEASDEGHDKKPIHASDLEAAINKRSDEATPNAPNGSSNANKKDASSAAAKTDSAKNESRSSNAAGATATATSSSRQSSAKHDTVKLHPCLRVYGFCNFKDDCTFARYPYDACLNNIKGKCRFGSNCKELHVNPNDSKYHNPRNPGSSNQNRQKNRDE